MIFLEFELSLVISFPSGFWKLSPEYLEKFRVTVFGRTGHTLVIRGFKTKPRCPKSKKPFAGRTSEGLWRGTSDLGYTGQKVVTPNSFKILAFVLKICLRYFFHNFMNGDNLEVDSPIIRKILSYCFYVNTV